jgi:hypothetical protein
LSGLCFYKDAASNEADGQVHKRRNSVLDNEFSPAYNPFMKMDRLHKALSIVC